jgi:hypothetical protein
MEALRTKRVIKQILGVLIGSEIFDDRPPSGGGQLKSLNNLVVPVNLNHPNESEDFAPSYDN